MTKRSTKAFIVSALMLVSFSNYAATLTCKGVDSDKGQIRLQVTFDKESSGQNVPMSIRYQNIMSDGYNYESSWKDENSNIIKTESGLTLQAYIGDYSWVDFEMNLQTQDGIHYEGESSYIEDDSGWRLDSIVQNIKCVLE